MCASPVNLNAKPEDDMTSEDHRPGPAVRLYDLIVCIGSHLQSFVLLALRLTWGWQLLESGYGHLTHVQKTVEAFKGWGVPLPQVNVYISGGTELVGGALLILGLATRLISLPLIFNFIIAYVTASRATLTQLISGPERLDGYDKFINDSAFPMLILALAMLAFGPGKISIDCLLKLIWRRRSGKGPQPGSIDTKPPVPSPSSPT
jgi:putative oxidoreductase